MRHVFAMAMHRPRKELRNSVAGCGNWNSCGADGLIICAPLLCCRAPIGTTALRPQAEYQHSTRRSCIGAGGDGAGVQVAAPVSASTCSEHVADDML